MNDESKIAYFSMEVALESDMPTYSGGLGILAGDMIRSAANQKVPMVAITLLYRKGYFYQRLDASGWQTEEPVEWVAEDFLEEMPTRVKVTIEDRPVSLKAWKYEVVGYSGHVVPVIFLDADLKENSEWDRTLTHYLYGGDQHYRLCQEVILGIGGIRMIQACGYKNINRHHMNEGHSSLLTLELLDDRMKETGATKIGQDIIDAVRKKCIFTTHTPVPAGHDQFPIDMARRVLSGYRALESEEYIYHDGTLNMTYLALNFSHYINGVAKKHQEVSKLMFAGYKIDDITNGVNASEWVSEPFQILYDRYIPGWPGDNFSLRSALSIPRQEIWNAHTEIKKELIHHVNRETNAGFELDDLTIGFARRSSTYKRADLIFQDINRLKAISSNVGPIQIIYSGKAHPQDQGGKELIKRIFQAKELLKPEVKVAYLENYDMNLAKLITSGVDLWLNTPIPPLEASGTSGMKAALNGIPSLSILDGWWIEGCIEGLTGWAIGDKESDKDVGDQSSKDADSLYVKLETIIGPLFYQNRDHYIDIMLHTIALNGSFFNTQRMVQQYVLKAYFE